MEKEIKTAKTSADVRKESLMNFLSVSFIAVAVAIISSFLHIRLDLTEDHRYTLSKPTRKILSNLEKDIYIQVWLDGEMPVQFKKLRRSVRETLDEFRIASGRKIDYEFINPSDGKTQEERNRKYESLIAKGLNPVNIQSKDQEGGTVRKIIFPGMTINCNKSEIPVNFLKNDQTSSSDANFLHSLEGLEYEIIKTVSTITSDSIRKIVFIEGQNELNDLEVADATMALANYYSVDRGKIDGRLGVLSRYSAVIIAAPSLPFNEKDKLAIDQYIMGGGKVLWLLNEVAVNEDSLRFGETVAMYRPLNIDDQLFRYGVRINPVVLRDLDCVPIPMKVVSGGSEQLVPVPWIYYPLLTGSQQNPVTRNINRVVSKYPNYIDTVGRDPGISKSVLLSSSKYVNLLTPPAIISLKDADIKPVESQFNHSFLPVAVGLSGKFESVFRNRLVESLVNDRNYKITETSVNTRMIVVSDGSIIRNDVRTNRGQLEPVTLGMDRYTGQVYGNKDFIVNCVNWLADDDGLLQLRSREMKMRLLDRQFIKDKRMILQALNVLLPLLLVIASGILFNILRRKRYISTAR